MGHFSPCGAAPRVMRLSRGDGAGLHSLSKIFRSTQTPRHFGQPPITVSPDFTAANGTSQRGQRVFLRTTVPMVDIWQRSTRMRLLSIPIGREFYKARRAGSGKAARRRAKREGGRCGRASSTARAALGSAAIKRRNVFKWKRALRSARALQTNRTIHGPILFNEKFRARFGLLKETTALVRLQLYRQRQRWR